MLPLSGDGSIDVSGGPWRMIEVPAAANAPAIVRTPDGWLALSHRVVGDARAPSGWQNALYRSSDGVSWHSIPLDPDSEHVQLHDLAYGGGRYVMVGSDRGEGVLWTSSDAEHWTQTSQGVDSTRIWRELVFVHDRFLALGFSLIGVSADGQSFTQLASTTVQPTAAAYGNGRYVVVGSGPMQVSTDSLHWQAHDVDCALPAACITDPSGGVHQGVELHVVFAEGRFFTDQLSSADGVEWKAEPGRSPAAYASGHFLDDGGFELHAWRNGSTPQPLPVTRMVEASATEDSALTRVGVLDRDAPLPARVDVGFGDVLTCETATCVLIGSRLYLVPPPGTAPLPDRVLHAVDGGA